VATCQLVAAKYKSTTRGARAAVPKEGGATVLRGHIGFGHSSRIHTTKILRLSQDLPVVVEFVDSKEKIDAFLPVLDGMMTSGLVTIEKVQVLHRQALAIGAASGRMVNGQ